MSIVVAYCQRVDVCVTFDNVSAQVETSEKIKEMHFPLMLISKGKIEECNALIVFVISM
jgi:hypothetical protein